MRLSATTLRRSAGVLALTLAFAPAALAQFWEPAGAGITGSQALSARAIAASADGVLLYGGGGAANEAPAADAGIYRSTDGGQTWTHVHNANPRVIRFLNGTAFAATANGGIRRSLDGGVTWAAANTGITRNDFYALATNEAESAVVAGTITGVFRSLNNGNTWTLVGPGIDTNALAFGPGEDVWAGEYNFDGNQPGIFYSNSLGDAGSWQPRGLQGESVNAITVGPDGTVWVGVSPAAGVTGGLFRSTNNGGSWTRITAVNDAIWAVVALDAQRIYAGGSFGAYVSTDGGATWAEQNTGFPGQDGAIRSMAYSASDGRLYVAERFTDIAVYRSVNPVVSSEGEATPQALALAAPYPNPVRGAVTLAFALPQAETVSLRVYDLLGRAVVSLAEGVFPAGPHEATWTPDALPSGVYILRLQAGDRTAVRRFTLVR